MKKWPMCTQHGKLGRHNRISASNSSSRHIQDSETVASLVHLFIRLCMRACVHVCVHSFSLFLHLFVLILQIDNHWLAWQPFEKFSFNMIISSLLWQSCHHETCLMFTLTTLGTFVAAFIKSSDARCVLLRTKSSDGPISSTSTRGVRLPDFFSNTLKKN